MRTYLLGPLLSFLPKRLRQRLPFAQSIRWTQAAFLSGFAEFLIAVYALIYWYSISVTTWVEHGIEVALKNGGGSGLNDHAIGAAGLILWATHPLTWFLGYLGVEGAVRFCGAAFADTILGTLPLFLLDLLTVKIFRVEPPAAGEKLDVPAGSFASAIRDKFLMSTLPKAADKLSFTSEGGTEILRIDASRPKPDWAPPRVVRYLDNYYRLEACSRVPGVRPFRYTLRRLAAGVPGRTVLIYSPE